MSILRKKISILLIISLLFSLIAGCGSQQTNNPNGKKLKVGLALATGGKGDKSFNDSAIEGLENAKKKLGIDYKDVQPRDVSEDEVSLDFLAKSGYDLIIGLGFMMKDAVKKVALKYPNVKFAIIDAEYGEDTPPNVVGIVYKEQESSFLAGALAALMTKTDSLGFVGGMDTPLIRRFEQGYINGARYINPKIEVASAFVGTDSGAFNNPDKAKEIAINMISSKKVDIIYHAAGASGLGVFEAASNSGIKAIGCDLNQNWIKPGTIFASSLKRVDVSVENMIELVAKGNYKGGTTKTFTLDDEGVGLTDLSNLTKEEITGVSLSDQNKIKQLKDSIPQDVKIRIAEIKNKIISGEIKVAN